MIFVSVQCSCLVGIGLGRSCWISPLDHLGRSNNRLVLPSSELTKRPLGFALIYFFEAYPVRDGTTSPCTRRKDVRDQGDRCEFCCCDEMRAKVISLIRWWSLRVLASFFYSRFGSHARSVFLDWVYGWTLRQFLLMSSCCWIHWKAAKCALGSNLSGWLSLGEIFFVKKWPFYYPKVTSKTSSFIWPVRFYICSIGCSSARLSVLYHSLEWLASIAVILFKRERSDSRCNLAPFVPS